MQIKNDNVMHSGGTSRRSPNHRTLPGEPRETNLSSRNLNRVIVLLVGAAIVLFVPRWERTSFDLVAVQRSQVKDHSVDNSHISDPELQVRRIGKHAVKGTNVQLLPSDGTVALGGDGGEKQNQSSEQPRLELQLKDNEATENDANMRESEAPTGGNNALVMMDKTFEKGTDEEKKRPLAENGGKLGSNTSQVIKRIAVLGERNSGTRWIDAELNRCFPDMSVVPSFIRWKHWFQTDDPDLNINRDPTLVVCMFRNPYEWMEAMRHVPHHAPNHMRMLWDEFINTPWTMKRPKRDLDLKNKDGPVCQEGFHYQEIISCVAGSREDPEYKDLFDPVTGFNILGHNISKPLAFSAHQPIYELKQDGSGDSFANILEMREAKIRNFLSIKEWDWVPHHMVFQYEKLLEEGTEKLIKQVEEATGLERKCIPAQPQKRHRRDLHPLFIRYLTENVDWDTEKLIGYGKWSEPTEEYSQMYYTEYRAKRSRRFWMKKYQPTFYAEQEKLSTEG